MTNQEKEYLANRIKAGIFRGYTADAMVKQLEPLGFKPKTIKKYYKIFQKPIMDTFIHEQGG